MWKGALKGNYDLRIYICTLVFGFDSELMTM